ncbi:hypothetical protein MHH66_22595 [Bacillus sp. FSL H8-0492]|uniref:hypothetical protein n=2 Tax=Bacillaceae TaxID=186817 RepID=UPI00099358BD|nr:hypothetical protein [Bacillus mycoides]OOR63427.1 hypothetical protein BLX04_08155 [Bacillus mycoides]
MGRMNEDYELVYEKKQIDERSEYYWNSIKKKVENYFSWIKGISIILLAVMFVISTVQPINLKFPIEHISKGTIILSICGGIVFHMIITFIIHVIAFYFVTGEGNFKKYAPSDVFMDNVVDQEITGEVVAGEKRNWFLKLPRQIFNWTVNIDYTLASVYKKKLEKNIFMKCNCNTRYISRKNKRCMDCYDLYKFLNKFFIKFSNWLNVSCVALGMSSLLFFLIWGDNFKEIKDIFIIVASAALFYRLVSRSLEIGKAFYADAVRVDSKIFFLNRYQKKEAENDEGTYIQYKEKVYLHKWKNSYIRKPMRISLAVHSLFELTLMFAMMYILTFLIFDVNSLDHSKVGEYIKGDWSYEFLLYSISLSFFNISFVNYDLWIWNILHVWQVAMSMVLIILSIAAYLGESDDVSERESDFYAAVLDKEKS